MDTVVLMAMLVLGFLVVPIVVAVLVLRSARLMGSVRFMPTVRQRRVVFWLYVAWLLAVLWCYWRSWPPPPRWLPSIVFALHPSGYLPHDLALSFRSARVDARGIESIVVLQLSLALGVVVAMLLSYPVWSALSAAHGRWESRGQSQQPGGGSPGIVG